MAVTRRTNTGNYYSLMSNGFTQKVSEGTEGAIKRTKKTGEDVYEVYADVMENQLLINARLNENEWKKGQKTIIIKSITLTMKDLDDDSTNILSIPLASRHSKSFLRRLPNIDLEQPIDLELYNYDSKQYLVIYQGTGKERKKVDFAFTRENPNGMPEIIVSEDSSGNPLYIDKDQMEFLLDVLDKTEFSSHYENLDDGSEEEGKNVMKEGSKKEDSKKEESKKEDSKKAGSKKADSKKEDIPAEIAAEVDDELNDFPF